MNLDNIADITQVNEGFNKIDELLTEHEEKKVSSEGGVHGLRFNAETEELEIEKQDGEWTGVGGGGAGASFDPVKDIKVKADNGKLTISWSDPESNIFNTWAGTKVIYKVGSYPENPKDGTLVVDNKVKDQYKTTGFDINALNNGTKYYFMFFPYNIKNKYSLNVDNRATGTPVEYKIFTCKITETTPDPDARVTYEEGTNLEPKSSDWDDFFGHRPCLFKDGEVVGWLKRDDYTKFEDGRTADITSGDAGDVMMCFPRRGLKLNKIGDVITISITNKPDDGNFDYFAHSRGGVRKDNFFVGVYKGWVDSSGKLRSLKGKMPNTNSRSVTRQKAQSNGAGYEQFTFYILTYLQSLFVLKYKSTNSQLHIGVGTANYINTGGTETNGLDWGTSANNAHIKCLGIEDLWGNGASWVDGLNCEYYIYGSYGVGKLYTANNNFSENLWGYDYQGYLYYLNRNYLASVYGTSYLGFMTNQIGERYAASNTYYCDACYNSNSSSNPYLPMFGYEGTSDGVNGIFALQFDANSLSTNIGSRLVYY